jgi:hypothetical protein
MCIIQACEQLNAWLGGFQTMLNRMTVYNFKWFLHAMLFIHTQRVIKRQRMKEESIEDDENDEEGINIDEEEE